MQKLYNKDNPFETQILCPSRKGEAGIENCNTVLQDLLNPGKQSLTYGNTKFRVNDKIIMMKNNYSSQDGYFKRTWKRKDGCRYSRRNGQSMQRCTG